MKSRQIKIVVSALIASMSLLVACGGGGSGSAGFNSPGTVQSGGNIGSVVNIADSPSDRVIGFELTVNSISLQKSDGSTVSLLSAPRRVEVTHVSGSAEPLVLPSLSQGTYTSATITVSAPDVVYIDNTGRQVEKKDATLTTTWNIAFNPVLIVGASPVVLTIDVNARGSISIDSVTGNVTVTPVATILRAQVPGAGHENEQEVENGEFEHIIGQVTASSANAFTITTGSGAAFSFVTDGATNFEGAASAASLAANSMVRVEGTTQQDGSMLAKEVELLSVNGAEFEGMITRSTGVPVSTFDVVMQDGSGNGMSSDSLGNTMTVNISNNTKFRVDAGKINMGGLSLPAFSAASLSRGQRVEAESDNAPANGVLTAESVKLQQQALVGAVSANTNSQFTLTLPDDSAFKLLTGKNTVKVLMQQNTQMMNGATVTQGAVIKVRGLVFFDPALGAFTMVAGRITTP